MPVSPQTHPVCVCVCACVCVCVCACACMCICGKCVCMYVCMHVYTEDIKWNGMEWKRGVEGMSVCEDGMGARPGH